MTITFEPRRAFDGDRSGCPGKRHGTRSAYINYGCKCDDAREEERLYKHGFSQPHRLDVEPIRRRIHALYAVGHCATTISNCSGLSEIQVHKLGGAARKYVSQADADAVIATYILLADQYGECYHARAAAVRLDYPDPDAWIDIDDLEEVPVPLPDPEDVVDEVLVRRALDGDKAAIAELHDGAEKQAYVAAYLMRPGNTVTGLAELLGYPREQRSKAIPDVPAFVETYLTGGGTVTGLTRTLECSGTTARRHAQRLMVSRLTDLAREREAAGESWDDLVAYAVAVGAGYIAWGDHANTGKNRRRTVEDAAESGRVTTIG